MSEMIQNMVVSNRHIADFSSGSPRSILSYV